MENGNNQLIDLFDYIIDKFNIAIEVPKEQLTEFTQQFATKIINWELWNSIISIIICLLIISVDVILYRKLFGKGLKAFKDFWSNINLHNTQEGKLIALVLMIFVLVIVTIIILMKIYNIILCIVFPEKIILDFIGQYM